MQYHVLNMEATPHIQPPLEMPMPATAQTGWEIVAGLIVVYTIYFFVKEARDTRSLFPIYFWLGTFILGFGEALVDIAMGCFYPEVGQNMAYKMYGREIPIASYMGYVGGIAPAMYLVAKRIEEGATSAFIWKGFWLMGLGTAVYELITINLGLWTYYGVHPMRVFNYPLGIGVCNGAAFILCSVTVAKMRPYLTGSRQYMALLLLPIVFIAGEFGAGWPLYSVVHSVASLEYPVLPYIGLAITCLFAYMILYWSCEFAATDRAASRIAAIDTE